MKSFLVVENKIFSKLRMFSDQISVNRTETVHSTVWNMCGNLHYELYISKSYTTTKNTTDRQYTE